jgi:hypothetical protein
VKTKMEVRRTGVRTSHPVRVPGLCFVLGGIAFFVGGLTHPTGSGHGNKVQQLHDMLGRPGWYPSHAFLLAAVALIAGGLFASRQRRDLTSGMERLLRIVFVIGCIATVSMAVHLLAPLGAASVAGGKPSLLSRVQALNELVDALWAVSLAAVAVAGGLTGAVGNRLTIPFGLVGGLAFALASATIPFTDTFDPLFKVGSLLSVWAIAVGVIAVRHQS